MLARVPVAQLALSATVLSPMYQGGGVWVGVGGPAASRLSSPTDRHTGCLQTCSFQSSCVWVFDPSRTSEDCCDADASTENRLGGGVV